MNDMTIVQHIDEALTKADRKKRSDPSNSRAAREFALAITALEDAKMRVNRGVTYLLDGDLAEADVERETAQV